MRAGGARGLPGTVDHGPRQWGWLRGSRRTYRGGGGAFWRVHGACAEPWGSHVGSVPRKASGPLETPEGTRSADTRPAKGGGGGGCPMCHKDEGLRAYQCEYVGTGPPGHHVWGLGVGGQRLSTCGRWYCRV